MPYSKRKKKPMGSKVKITSIGILIPTVYLGSDHTDSHQQEIMDEGEPREWVGFTAHSELGCRGGVCNKVLPNCLTASVLHSE